MLKRFGLILVLLFCCLSLTSCYDAVDINDLGYVTMLGLDFGTKDDWQFTFQYPEFEGGENAGAGSMKYATLVLESASFYTAVQLANTNLPKELNFMHLKTLVFSQELAESGELNKMLTSLIRFKQIRRTVNILICKGKAFEFVDASKPYMGNLITDTLEELLGNSHTTGLLPEVPLNTFYNAFMSPYNEGVGILGAINKGDNLPEAAEAQKKALEQEGGGSQGDASGGGDSGNVESKEKPSGEEDKGDDKEKEKDNKTQEGEKANEISGDIVAGEVLRAGGNELEVLGSALFSKGKMVGSLTGFETQMMLMLRGELERSVFSMPDPQMEDYQVAIDIREFDTPQYKIRIEDGKPKINVRVFLEGEIVSIQSRINYEDPDKQEPLKKAFEEYINKGLEQTIKKCQEKNTDVLSFGQRAANHFATIQEWEKYKWNEKFSQAEIKTEVEFTVRRTGTMTDSYHVEERSGLP